MRQQSQMMESLSRRLDALDERKKQTNEALLSDGAVSDRGTDPAVVNAQPDAAS